MGWLFSTNWPTRASMREHLCNDNGLKTIKSCWKGNNLWAVQEYTYDQGEKAGQTVRFIALYLVRWHGGDCKGWGYKDMDESAGPYYYNCPLSYLDMVPDPGGYATEWRAKVREQHAASTRKLVEGQKIRLYGTDYDVGKPRGKGTYWIWMTGTSAQFHLPRRMLKHVEVLG